ncbi:hypothetical protein DL95DRAFT_485591 [Leptodontidium sp. 2 PMI_412]|nr:hypothetical protein DL95DRAFT_485591 [Leptodontidium sp. 2 PMI_412]
MRAAARRPREDLREEEGDKWNSRHYFQMHDFCRPSEDSLRYGESNIQDPYSDSWVPLSDFVKQLSGLQDLVWTAGSSIPPSILSAVSQTRCRLHIHEFEIPSLIQELDNPQPVSLEDYALCTFPFLSSIVARVGSFESFGKLNYIEEAIMRMTSGLAPNLTHLCVISEGEAGELDIDEAIALGKPDWKGFFPGQTSSHKNIEQATTRSSTWSRFRTLVFPDYVPRGVDHWARITDFAVLQCLVMPWNLMYGTALAGIASRGELKSLQKMELFSIEDETEESQDAFNLLLSSLNPLHRLDLGGYVSPATFQIVIHRHGPGLRALRVQPQRDEDERNPLVVFSAAVLAELASYSPHLTHLSLPISRTGGDKHEVAIYRCLSKLPCLEHLCLRLDYCIGPDEEFWNEERDGEHPLNLEVTEGDTDKIPFQYLKEAFSNGAVNETLARGIFELISGGTSGHGRLRYLRLEVTRKAGYNAVGNHSAQFRATLRWFNRSFACTRDIHRTDEVTVTALGLKDLASAEKQWRFMMSNKEKFRGEEVFVEVFRDLWPQKTKDWWNDWESLPLDLSDE